jgi:UDP-2,3-diacylglucosamine hydrolase
LSIPFQHEKEPLYQFAQAYAKEHPIDYFIFGHLHTPIVVPVGKHSQLVVLGGWIHGCEYAVFDGTGFELR